MTRRLLVPLLASALLLAASAGSALAKCEGPNPPSFCSQVLASLSVGGGPAISLVAGTATSVDVTVTRGEAPFTADSVLLVFTRTADGTVVQIAAEPVLEGLWRADVNLPAGGGWRGVADVEVGGTMQHLRLDTLSVGAAPEAPEAPVTTPPTTPVTPAPPAVPIGLLVAGIAAAAIVAIGLRQRSRRRLPAG